MNRSLCIVSTGIAIAAMTIAACTDTESSTNLHPEGPPMVQEVLVTEIYADSTGLNFMERRVFGFGTYPTATIDMQHPVTSAKVLSPGNNLRVIMDELLVGNYLQEIQCREIVDDDAFDTVPIGDTPDDVANCTLPTHEELLRSCKGPKAICICKKAGGCGTAAEGEPSGIVDVNQDGAADTMRLIQGSVGVQCAGTAGNIDVPIDLDASYWNPSGNQQTPAMGGIEALGPAIVLFPKGIDITPGKPSQAYPTNTDCQLTFAESVVDKQGNRVCAPPNGDITKDCTPGDVSAFKFKTEPLRATQIQGIPDESTDVPRDQDLIGVLSAPVGMAGLTGITMTENGNPFTAFTITFVDAGQSKVKIHPTAAGGFAATTPYTVTFTTSIVDLYGQALPTPVTFHFTTGM